MHIEDYNKDLTDREEISWSVYKGVGTAYGIHREIAAVKLALQDSLMIDALKTHENIMVQVIGDVSLLEFNHAIDYIQQIAGKTVAAFGGCNDCFGNPTDGICVVITVYS
ncbi:hypothetical protein [Roseburia sp. 499]|uniref:hypothetical protein n=1 Tax=Roseburia sp. 499 TaxID=1261634 RepID=UPI00095219F0|nr:hypothetical protein [Roseburia sp. 499]WVK69428.1 hypothetical protein BIV20_13850 [Roseburia sp. 499]